MNRYLAICRAWICLLCSVPLLFAAGGCSKESPSARPEQTREVRAKLDEVHPEMLRLSSNDEEKSCLRAAQPFVNIRGLDMQVAGFSIPMGTNGKQAHVSFTVDHLKKTTREALAKEALEDFRIATQASGGK
jgi:hypothetical protein